MSVSAVAFFRAEVLVNEGKSAVISAGNGDFFEYSFGQRRSLGYRNRIVLVGGRVVSGFVTEYFYPVCVKHAVAGKRIRTVNFSGIVRILTTCAVTLTVPTCKRSVYVGRFGNG